MLKRIIAIVAVITAGTPGFSLDYDPWAGYLHVPGEYSTIQSAIDIAVDGDVVLVANGTYKGDGNRNIDFLGKAITVTSENGPVESIIDCENDGTGFYFENGEDSDSMIEGLTIRNGYTSIYGGGIHCSYFSDPIITNCVIMGNTAGYQGGGIRCYYSSPTITNCTISKNAA